MKTQQNDLLEQLGKMKTEIEVIKGGNSPTTLNLTPIQQESSLPSNTTTNSTEPTRPTNGINV